MTTSETGALDALLVYLPVQFGGGRTFGLPPLGVYCLATQLNVESFNARVLDASIKGLTLDETVDEIKRRDPKLIGFSAMTPHLRSLKAIIDRLNADGFRDRIVVGGAHFNVTEAEAFEYLDVDYIFYSESEIEFPKFVRAFLDESPYDHIGGLARRKGEEIVINPVGEFIADLDDLPFPDLGLGAPDDYEFISGRYDRVMTMMASRGCPYRCIFCDEPVIWGRKTRFRSAKNVVDEMEWHLRELGIREFNFKDSTFTLNYKWIDRFLDELESRKLDVLWHCHTRIDRVNEPMLRRMRDLGLRSIAYGIESGDQGILDNIKKKIRVEDIEPVFRMTERLRIQAQVFMMIGHIGETPETAKKTIDLTLKLPATFASFSVNIAYPKTQSYNWAKELGLLDERWYLQELGEKQFLSVSAEASPGQLNLPNLPPEQQIAIAKMAYRKFFFRPSTIMRVLLRFSSLRLLKRSLLFLPKFLGFVLSSSRHQPTPVRAGAHS